eukprot:7386261-Prymnesium_polylepis.4
MPRQRWFETRRPASPFFFRRCVSRPPQLTVGSVRPASYAPERASTMRAAALSSAYSRGSASTCWLGRTSYSRVTSAAPTSRSTVRTPRPAGLVRASSSAASDCGAIDGQSSSSSEYSSYCSPSRLARRSSSVNPTIRGSELLPECNAASVSCTPPFGPSQAHLWRDCGCAPSPTASQKPHVSQRQ